MSKLGPQNQKNSGSNKPSLIYAGMMELADMRDLGSRAATRWGSNPHTRTKNLKTAVRGDSRKEVTPRGRRK